MQESTEVLFGSPAQKWCDAFKLSL